MDELPRFWVVELDEFTKPDLLRSLANGELVGIVDEESGGIIGYMLREHGEDAVIQLNTK